jgi:hypothetical protein
MESLTFRQWSSSLSYLMFIEIHSYGHCTSTITRNDFGLDSVASQASLQQGLFPWNKDFDHAYCIAGLAIASFRPSCSLSISNEASIASYARLMLLKSSRLAMTRRHCDGRASAT